MSHGRFLLVFFLQIAFLLPFLDARKLLVFSVTSSRSHMLSNGRIADSLAAAGHDVTLLQLQCVIKAADLQTAKLAKVVNIGRVTEEVSSNQMSAHKAHIDAVFNPKPLDVYYGIKLFVKVLTDVCEVALKEDLETIEALRREKFEAVFVEQLFPCGNAMAHVLDIPVHFIVNSCTITAHISYLFGLPMPLGYVPADSDDHITDSMSFVDRVWNSFQYFVIALSYENGYFSITQLFRKYYGNKFPDVASLIRERTPIVFVASSEFIDFPRPITHNVVYMGGLGMGRTTHNASLSPELGDQMEKGKNGVIFFSLGTNVYSSALPMQFKRNILDAFAAFPDWHFIVKLEKEDVEGIAHASSKSNVFVTHWAHQAAVLAHPRLQLFVTHGGYNSLLEVAMTGKPVLLIPMMYDQGRNAQVVARNGWGKTVSRMDVLKSSSLLKETLVEMLASEKYKAGAKRIQHLLLTKPFSADDLFLKNVEFVLENDGRLPELTSISAKLSLVQQFNLDIFLVIVAVFLLTAILILLTAWAVLRRVLFSRRPNHQKTE